MSGARAFADGMSSNNQQSRPLGWQYPPGVTPPDGQDRSSTHLLTFSGMPSTGFPRLTTSWLCILIHTTHTITVVQRIAVPLLPRLCFVTSRPDQMQDLECGSFSPQNATESPWPLNNDMNKATCPQLNKAIQVHILWRRHTNWIV